MKSDGSGLELSCPATLLPQPARPEIWPSVGAIMIQRGFLNGGK